MNKYIGGVLVEIERKKRQGCRKLDVSSQHFLESSMDSEIVALHLVLISFIREPAAQSRKLSESSW